MRSVSFEPENLYVIAVICIVMDLLGEDAMCWFGDETSERRKQKTICDVNSRDQTVA